MSADEAETLLAGNMAGAVEEGFSTASSTTLRPDIPGSESPLTTMELLTLVPGSSETRTRSPPPGRLAPSNAEGFLANNGRESDIAEPSPGNAWAPGMWNSLPHRGLWSLLGCLAGIVASVVVLVEANGSPKSNWRISPTVYISAFTAITNTLARFSFNHGTRITWWRSALHGGTINDLHSRWAHSDGFWTALFAGRHTNAITLASIAVTIIVIDQPLIQRAVNVVPSPETKPTIVTGVIAPEIPWGFTSFQEGEAFSSQLMSEPMITVFNSFHNRLPIQAHLTGCDGVCRGSIQAGGVAARCETISGPNTYAKDAATMHDGPSNTNNPFSINFELDYEKTAGPQIIANIVYTRFIPSDTPCTAVRTERKCHLASATLEYPVTLKDGLVTLGDLTGQAKVVGYQPVAPGQKGEAPTNCCGQGSQLTLGGLYAAATIMYNSSALLHRTPGPGIGLVLNGAAASLFLDLPPLDLAKINTKENLTQAEPCKTNWTDPTENLLINLNTMAFMLSISAATFQYRNTSAPPPPREWTMSQTRSINVYQTNYQYMIASVVLTTVFVLFITPTFTGWWELGRDVSLNPIETAKAFDAPLLSGPGSNAPLAELTRTLGTRRVKWGEVETVEAGADGGATSIKRLVFSDSAGVVPPTKGTVYG